MNGPLPLRAQQAVDVLMPKRNRRQPPLTRARNENTKQASGGASQLPLSFHSSSSLSLSLRSLSPSPLESALSNNAIKPASILLQVGSSARQGALRRCGVRRLPRASFTASLSLARSHTLELWKQQHDVAWRLHPQISAIHTKGSGFRHLGLWKHVRACSRNLHRTHSISDAYAEDLIDRKMEIGMCTDWFSTLWKTCTIIFVALIHVVVC